jgi:glycosyltransferase involved in cell wall biosynthesis
MEGVRGAAVNRTVRLLVLTPVPEEGAGCRFRISQFVPALERAGFAVTIAPFFDTAFFQLVYRQGMYGAKLRAFLRQTAARLRLLLGRNNFDMVFVYREAFPFGPPMIEALLARHDRPLVYDFDDAIFLSNSSQANRFASVFKYPEKVASIITRSSAVIAGNEYLAGFARAHNPLVTVIPTCIDTDVFAPRAGRETAGVPVVGWIGTPTTAAYLRAIAAPLARLAATRKFVFRVSGSGERIAMDGVSVANEPWSLDGEVRLFSSCDVGVYPLADDEWARGKCGFKAIQFMACGVPVVASAVGVNREIIQDGVNGFLASNGDEWVEKIGRLLDDPALGRRLGAAGRQTIEERYSLRVNAPKIVATLRGVVDRSSL